MNNEVFIVHCPDYDQVQEKLPVLLDRMGGIELFAAQGESLALKVNLLVSADPARAVTTHPSLPAAVGRSLKKAGADALIIDSPSAAYHYDENTLQRLYRNTGMEQAAREAGIRLNFDTAWQTAACPEGKIFKQFDVLDPLLKADGIINLSKFKTHSLMGMTGAIKNMFGSIPGRKKAGFHGKLPDPGLFAQMLLDLAGCLAPRLCIMDAVVGMEGNGPGNGDPREIGFLLASENPLALDIVVSAMMGLAEDRNPLIQEARNLGYFPATLADVELIGMDPSDLPLADFILPDTYRKRGGRGLAWVQETFSPVIKDAFSLKPVVQKEVCIACGDCSEICPMQVITIHDNDGHYAEIQYDECIRCYCCHETCPQDAIQLEKTTLYRLLEWINI